MLFFRAFFKDLFIHRKLIFELAKRDFQSAYFGSALGLTWSFLEPLIYIGIMWFFFTKALRYSPSGNTPYIAWLMTTMILWYFVSGSISATTSIFRNYAYMMKKWEFNISILPVVSLLSAFFNHAIFIFLLVIIYAFTGVPFSLYWLQITYYILATCFFVVGITWVTASLNLFYKDIRNIITIGLQLTFWVSPIFWEIEAFPEKYRPFIRLNPLFHIMEGYRNSFLNHRFFWEDKFSFLYFWSFCAFLWIVGAWTYRKLRPYFGEVI